MAWSSETRELLGERLCDQSIWTAIKPVYSSLIVNSPGWEIAESFFNSLTRRVFATEGVDQTIEFIDTDFDSSAGPEPAARRIHCGRSLTQLIIQGLTSSPANGFERKDWDNLPGSAAEAAVRLETAFAETAGTSTTGPGEWQLELIDNAFYRGRGAYYVGCLRRAGDEGCNPPAGVRPEISD